MAMSSDDKTPTSLYQMPPECCRCLTRQGNDHVRVDRIIDSTGTPFVGTVNYQALEAPVCSQCLEELRTLARQAAKHQRTRFLKIIFIAIGVYIAAWITRFAAPSLSYLVVALGAISMIAIFVCIVLAALAKTRQFRGYKDSLAFWDVRQQRVMFQNSEYQKAFDRLNGLK